MVNPTGINSSEILS